MSLGFPVSPRAWCASIWLGPATPLLTVLAIDLLFDIFLGTVNPPITNTAVSGMPRSMAGVAASLTFTGRQTGTTLGVAISGTIVGSALARGGTAYTTAEHGVWWLVLGLGIGILILALLSTGRWASNTARRAAAQLEDVDRPGRVHHGIARLQRDQRYRGEEAILIDLARRGESIYPDLDGALDLPHPALDYCAPSRRSNWTRVDQH